MNIDAKQAWLNQVKKHKKRQRGLPALSTLNTSAGNVEHNINMFNMMQGSNSVTVDAVNGNISGGMVEAMEKSNTVELEYTKLPITQLKLVKDAYYDSNFGNYLPADYADVDRKVDWTYHVDRDDVIMFLSRLPEVIQALGAEDMYDDEFEQLISDNLEELVNTHYNQILANFQDDAISDAEEHYHESIEPTTESTKELIVERVALDDNFDMSMRTLL